MAYQRLQPSRALPIIPTDDLILPGGPGAELASGLTTSVLADSLVDNTVNFNSIIKAGDTVYNLTAGLGARVIGVPIDNTPILPNPPESFTLTLSDNIFTVIGESYAVYSVVEGGGAVLWVSTGGSILGKTAGGDDIVLNNVPDGSLLPILMSVINQTGTTATGMYGLW
tara:strand:- start:12369 stop:12875 length:507 start_codon:yes stop_codon:yes gene_type:complete